ncbi:MAG: HEAT repeat domain-containing protein, partial [Gemmatimonadetes bacterium]|nr:HEAT repeat domain-containing protein [Gemmatimonadota bacterium]
GGMRGYPEFDDHGRPLWFPANPQADSADIFPGTDFRFRPDQFVVQPAGGMSQFGYAFDSGGNRFTVWNSRHLQHVVIPHRYVTRNPALHVGNVMASIPDHGDAAAVYSITWNPLNLHESEIGHFTSASGTSMYTGGIFPDEYRNAAFVTEPVHNLVHVDLLTATGATFVARRAREGKEFLASTDSWFRPVNTTVGPDGGLYIADFYRKLVEHPAWIARADSQGIYTFAGVLQESDFLEGQDRGRIYRVVPEGHWRAAAERPSLSRASGRELVRHLAHPNMWWRATAQRLLVDRRDRSVVGALERLAAEPGSPEGKIHALWTLEGLAALEDEVVLRALREARPEVREQAVRLAELRLGSPGIADALLRMAGDADDRVQFQIALTLGELPGDRSFDALRQIAAGHLPDPWFQTAALSASGTDPLRWFAALREGDPSRRATPGRQQFVRRVASLAGARQDGEEIGGLLGAVTGDDDGRWILEGVAEGLQRGRRVRAELTSAKEADLLRLLEAPAAEVRQAALAVASRVHFRGAAALRAVTDRAARIIVDPSASTAARVHAIRVMGLDPGPSRVAAVAELADPRHPSEVQLAAVGVLIEKDDLDATRALLRRWNGYPLAVRDVAERGLLARPRHAAALLDAVAAGEVDPARIGRGTRARLTGHSDLALRERAGALFRDAVQDSREAVIRRYHQATVQGGDPASGRTVFQRVCSACHKVGDIGSEVGPDLASLTNRTRIDLMAQTLHPNDNIAPGYEAYLLETSDGRSFSGVMAEESPVSVSLRAPGGAEQTFSRSIIARLEPLSVSLMPEGLEGAIDVREMADLLSYLKSLK